MGQKVNPHGLRVGVIKGWDSRWYARDDKFGDILVSDYKVRKYIKEKLFQAGIPQVEIDRDCTGRTAVTIHCAKPGLVIGRGGADIEKYRREISEILGAPVTVNVVEVKPVDMCAQLVAENIAAQLERRVAFRRAMKMAIGRTMRLGAKGIKISLSGRLGGAEIARTEHYHEGTIPLQTIRADIDYGFWEANTTYGKIGVKVWIYKGEVLNEMSARVNNDRRPPRKDRRDRRDDRREGGERRGDRRDGNRGFNRKDDRRENMNRQPGGRQFRENRPAPKAPAAKTEGGEN